MDLTSWPLLLRTGKRNGNVLRCERRLNAVGLLTAEHMNGYSSHRTTRASRAFQQRAGCLLHPSQPVTAPGPPRSSAMQGDAAAIRAGGGGAGQEPASRDRLSISSW